MSALAPARQPSSLPPALSPRRAPAPHKPTGLPRPRLVLVTQRRNSAVGRLPFVILVGAILVLGLVGALLLHMIAAQDGFRATAMSSRLTTLTNDAQALQQQVDADSGPLALQHSAAKLGMVPTSLSSFHRLGDGRAIGTQTPVSIPPPAPAAPRSTKAKTKTKTARATTKTATTTKTKTTTKTATTTGKAATAGKTGAGGKPKSPKSPTHHTRGAARR